MSTSHYLLNSEPNLEAACRAYAVPDRVHASDREAEFLAKGIKEHIAVGHDQVAYWTFGEGPRVLLAHGWGSRGSHLMGFVGPLLAAGFSVVLFDAPANGDSSGEVSSMVHAGRSALAIATRLGDVHATIGHSGGSTAMLWALSNGLSVARSVHLCGPSSVEPIVTGIARHCQLDDDQTQAFKTWAESLMGAPLSALSLHALSSGLSHPGLIIHDADDKVVDISQSNSLHARWPASERVITHGLGHRRILTDRHTITTAVEFLKN